jgi:hypothetical protein
MNGQATIEHPTARITIDPVKRSGQPCIRNLRITVKAPDTDIRTSESLQFRESYEDKDCAEKVRARVRPPVLVPIRAGAAAAPAEA